jgi:hypothetical protein
MKRAPPIIASFFDPIRAIRPAIFENFLFRDDFHTARLLFSSAGKEASPRPGGCAGINARSGYLFSASFH